MMRRSCGVLLLSVVVCLGQRSGTSGDRQIRLEDIERDNLAANQKTSPSSAASQPQQPAQQTPSQQQQLAAYQQQLLLQQLQQQYFAPPVAYSNFGGIPLMIIPNNQLGVGAPGGLPIQAYFVPAEPQYFSQYQTPVYQPFQRYQPAQRVPGQRLQPIPDLTYNSLQSQDLSSSYRQPQNYPSSSVVYAGTPHASSFQQPQSYQPQQSSQQLYNAYNALYQQRQEKNSFAAGVKSTPAPALKPQSQVYSQQSVSPVYSNYKSFNYNQ